jgi:hypothetical protein
MSNRSKVGKKFVEIDKKTNTTRRTKREQERGAVGEDNMSMFNPGKLISGKLARPDDATKSRTKKEQEQARGQRFIAPTKDKISEQFRGFGLAAGSVDKKTGKQIVSEDRDIPTRKQEKERAKLAKSKPKKKLMGGGMTKIKYRGGGIVSRSRPTKYV